MSTSIELNTDKITRYIESKSVKVVCVCVCVRARARVCVRSHVCVCGGGGAINNLKIFQNLSVLKQ
jgi:hypothetical protein